MFLFLGLITSTPVSGAPGEQQVGHCAAYDFAPFYHEGKLRWAGVVRVLRDKTPLYASSRETKVQQNLTFNQQAEVLQEEGPRLEVRVFRAQGQEAATGWVEKRHLLCRNLPLKASSGLEMKFFIRTGTAPRAEGEPEPTVKVFQDPELSECVGGKEKCREGASRFHMYFVFDVQDKAMLIADRFRLEEDDILLGWVNRNDGFLWNNAFGIRPREDLKSPDGKGRGTVCSYERLEDAVSRNAKACHPVEGGPDWFKSSMRVPVLEMVDEKGAQVAPEDFATGPAARRFYKVALARPGLVGRPVGDGKFAVSAGLVRGASSESTKSLSSKKNVDIFFLLDGTASMGAVIDAVRGTDKKKGVIQEIVQTLRGTQGFKDNQFRFGFRVYRDPYADKMVSGSKEGIGEGLPLGSNCQVNAKEQEENFKAFDSAIAKVQVSSETADDDYEENVYGGLGKVLKEDIGACPDHLKVLFVIGDAGYKDAIDNGFVHNRPSRSSKYHDAVSRELLVQLLRGSNQPGVKTNSIVPFFIQTPFRPETTKHPGAYKQAYDRFESQSRSLLTDSLPADGKSADHFLRMEEEKLTSRILGTVERFGGSALIDEIILDIRGGAALSSVIERLRRERSDIPGVYWHILKQGACGELGSQCEGRVYDTTLMGYVESTPDIVEELWVASSALSSWIRILRGFEGYFELPEPQLRRALISAMILGLQQEIRRPPIDVSGETPAEYAQRRGGLPVRHHSPLLSYHVASLSAEQTVRDDKGNMSVAGADGKVVLDKRGKPVPAVPVCELRRLALWAIKSRQMLEIVERDFNRPVFSTEKHQDHRCPDATENGRNLSRVVGNIEAQPLGPSKEFRFGHTFGGARGYWVPQDYLP
ncbi:MAG: hypothetical protein HQL56_02970 [Magnetococcales bacterium]|nr:hypothetical protein [Magnetococcales bacterium]